MKGLTFSQLGLSQEEVPKSRPEFNQTMIRVHAASINPIDIAIIGGKYQQIVDKPENHHSILLGRDFSGIIEEIGPDVWDFQPGDEVMGISFVTSLRGSHAEYVLAPESNLVHKPKNLTHSQAASLGYVGYLGLFLVENRVRDCDRVLIHGGSGGLGSVIIQFIKSLRSNCEVIVSCSERNFERVLSLRADFVVGSREPLDIHIPHQSVDYVIDLVGQEERLLPLLKRNASARFSSLHPNWSNSLQVSRLFDDITYHQELVDVLSWRHPLQHLSIMKALGYYAEQKLVVPQIDRIFPISKYTEAFDYFSSGTASGKVILDFIAN